MYNAYDNTLLLKRIFLLKKRPLLLLFTSPPQWPYSNDNNEAAPIGCRLVLLGFR